MAIRCRPFHILAPLQICLHCFEEFSLNSLPKTVHIQMFASIMKKKWISCFARMLYRERSIELRLKALLLSIWLSWNINIINMETISWIRNVLQPIKSDEYNRLLRKSFCFLSHLDGIEFCSAIYSWLYGCQAATNKRKNRWRALN